MKPFVCALLSSASLLDHQQHAISHRVARLSGCDVDIDNRFDFVSMRSLPGSQASGPHNANTTTAGHFLSIDWWLLSLRIPWPALRLLKSISRFPLGTSSISNIIFGGRTVRFDSQASPFPAEPNPSSIPCGPTDSTREECVCHACQLLLQIRQGRSLPQHLQTILALI